MEDDADGEIPFAATFPLPFRALFLVGMGILGWATNLHGLNLLGIDASSALGLNVRDGHVTPLPTNRHAGYRSVPHPSIVYSPVYRLFIAYSLWCFITWSIFRVATRSSIFMVDIFKYIPAIACLGILIVLACPFDVLQKRERDAFLLSFRRCLFPHSGRPIYFSDVVFADILTSFAKVFGDVWLSLYMLWPDGSLLDLPTQDGWLRWILPTLMSLPYALRLRQCLIEYRLPMNESRRPLYNALKYATSFPVIYLSAAQRIVVTELVAQKGEEVTKEAWHGEHQLFRLWLLSVLMNSLYSFWWDLSNDWGLDLLKPRSSDVLSPAARVPRPLILPSLHSRSASFASTTASTSSSARDDLSERLSGGPTLGYSRRYPYGLRPTLLFPLPFYPLVIFLNLILRLTWSIKLSSHLHSHAEGSVTIFWIEMAELVRRWMWVFIRVEWEVVRRTEEGRQRGINPDSGSPGEEEYELLSDHDGERSDI